MKVAIIPARKNSQRIKNKNIINFCGKPIISWPNTYNFNFCFWINCLCNINNLD